MLKTTRLRKGGTKTVKLKILLLSFLAVFLVTGSAMALELATNITIWDGMGAGSNGDPREDQEVEPGCVWGQEWDLEGFFLSGTTLTMVGGFNFVAGQQDPSRTWMEPYQSGDIFIDVNGNASYGATNTGEGGGNTVVDDTFGYDYVLDMNFESFTYDVYELTDATTLNVYFGQNEESNPWTYNEGGTPLVAYQGISFADGYWFDLSNSDVADAGLLGGTHYAAAVDLCFLDPGTEFIAHNTMQCGNDNLMGRGTTPVPEPATMLLLGTGLVCFAGFGRKRFFKRG